MFKELRSWVAGSASVVPSDAVLECRNCGMDVAGIDEVCPACGRDDVAIHEI